MTFTEFLNYLFHRPFTVVINSILSDSNNNQLASFSNFAERSMSSTIRVSNVVRVNLAELVRRSIKGEIPKVVASGLNFHDESLTFSLARNLELKSVKFLLGQPNPSITDEELFANRFQRTEIGVGDKKTKMSVIELTLAKGNIAIIECVSGDIIVGLNQLDLSKCMYCKHDKKVVSGSFVYNSGEKALLDEHGRIVVKEFNLTSALQDAREFPSNC